jgi:hypothetical protein
VSLLLILGAYVWLVPVSMAIGRGNKIKERIFFPFLCQNATQERVSALLCVQYEFIKLK